MSAPAKKKAPVFNPLATKEAAEMRQKRAGRAGGGKSDAKPSKRAAGKDNAKPPTPEPTADLEPQEPPCACYFDDRKGRYYLEDAAGRWIGLGMDDVRRELRSFGISGKPIEGKLVSPQDRVLRTIQRTRGVDFAGPLAGHFAGFVEMNGSRLLVTTSPKMPEPCAGEFTTLDKFLRGLFGVDVDAHGALQLAAFTLWAARGWRAITERKTLKGHALIVAGPAGCGKNILQEKIITTLLGGRAVKAADYLLGRTEFSGSMFAGESIILTDENAGRDIRSRREFGQRIKNMVANDVQEMHKKGCDSVSVCPRWRVSISVNDETEHLQTLPPVGDSDIKGKVHLMLCHRAEIPAGDDEFASWLAAIVEEIPTWLHHCLTLEVPAELREERPRFGTKAFQHPELLERLNSFSPELHLLALIDRLLTYGDAFAPERPEEWTGRASDLRAALLDAAKDKTMLEREISETIRTDELCGQYLKRLSQHEGTKARVQELPRTGKQTRLAHPHAGEGGRSMSHDQGEFAFKLPRPRAVRLSALDLATLRAAGAGANEIQTVMRAPDARTRAQLLTFFCCICADRFRLLRSAVAVVEGIKRAGVLRCAGADVIANMGRGTVRGFVIDNAVRCLLVRAVSIVRPDLRGCLEMKRGAKADVLLRLGWTPSAAQDWRAGATC